MPYDINAARRELTDSQIAESLAFDTGYDIEKARAAGMNDTQIADSIAFDLSDPNFKSNKSLPQPSTAPQAPDPAPTGIKALYQKGADFLGKVGQGISRVEGNLDESLRTALDPTYDKFPRGPEISGIPQDVTGVLTDDVLRAKTLKGKLNVIQKQYPKAKLALDDYGRPGVTLGQDTEEQTGPLGPTGRGGMKADDFIFFDKPTITTQDIKQIPNFINDNSVTIVGAGSTAGLNLLKGAATAFGAGATDEALKQTQNAAAGTGEGYSTPDILASGAFSALGEAGGRAVAGAIRKTAQFLSGKTGKNASTFVAKDGELTPDAIKALKAEGIDSADMVDFALKDVEEMIKSGNLTPAQASRVKSFEIVGAKPKRSEITRDFKDQRFEIETAKLSFAGEKLRQRVYETDQELIGTLEGIRGTQRDPVNIGVTLKDFVRTKKARADEEIGKLYKKIREDHGNVKVYPSSLGEKVIELKRFENLSPELEAFRKGILEKNFVSESGKLADSKGRFLKKPTLDDMELLRQEINSFTSTDRRTNMFLSNLKNAIDSDVTRSTGKDYFVKARAKAEAKFKEFEPNVKMSGMYGEDNSNIVQKIYEGRIADEDVIKTIVSKSTKLKDVDALKRTLSTGTKLQKESGTAVFDDIRAGVLEDAISKSVNRGAGERGGDVFSGAKFKTWINNIGYHKLKKLYTPSELRLISAVRHVGELRIPSDGVANTSGTATVLAELYRKVPGLKQLSALTDRYSASAALNSLKSIKSENLNKKSQPYRSFVTPLTAPYGGENQEYFRELDK